MQEDVSSLPRQRSVLAQRLEGGSFCTANDVPIQLDLVTSVFTILDLCLPRLRPGRHVGEGISVNFPAFGTSIAGIGVVTIKLSILSRLLTVGRWSDVVVRRLVSLIGSGDEGLLALLAFPTTKAATTAFQTAVEREDDENDNNNDACNRGHLAYRLRHALQVVKPSVADHGDQDGQWV